MLLEIPQYLQKFFILKDICWENDDIFKLGPIVSAQHIVNN